MNSQNDERLIGYSIVKPLPSRIPSLDGLRALSIALVMIGHSEETFTKPYHWMTPLFTVIGNGVTGVKVFFVISGFLITTLLLREREKAGCIDLRAFYVRRGFRILPAFYVFLTTCVVLAAIGWIMLPKGNLVMAALFLTNYWFGPATPLLGHTWSLSVEEQFYLLWPWAFAVLGTRRGSYLAMALILVTPLIRLATYAFIPSLRDHIPIMGHTRADQLMMGCLAAVLYSNARFQSLLQTLYRWQCPLIAGVFLFLVSPFINQRFGGAYTLPIGWSLEGAAITLVLLWLVQNPDHPVGRVFNWRPVAFVGVMSYSLYLWQQLFLNHLNTSFTGRFPLNIVFAFVAGLGSFYLIERPALRLRQMLTGDKRPAGPGI